MPSSCAVTMNSSRPHHAATVAFDPVGLIVNSASFDSVRARSSPSARSIANRHRGRGSRRTLLRVLPVDRKHRDASRVAHPLLRDSKDLGVVLAPRDALDRRRELPRVQALPCPDVPQLERVVGRAGDEVGGSGCCANEAAQLRDPVSFLGLVRREDRRTYSRRRRSRRYRCGRRRCRVAPRCASTRR